MLNRAEMSTTSMLIEYLLFVENICANDLESEVKVHKAKKNPLIKIPVMKCPKFGTNIMWVSAFQSDKDGDLCLIYILDMMKNLFSSWINIQITF